MQVTIKKLITLFHEGRKYEFPRGKHEVTDSIGEALKTQSSKAGVEDSASGDTLDKETPEEITTPL